MMTKAAGILITLIIVGVATTHSHAARPACPAGAHASPTGAKVPGR